MIRDDEMVSDDEMISDDGDGVILKNLMMIR